MKLAIVMPSGCVFSDSRPNSMETVVGTLAKHSRYRDGLRIFCDEGAADPVALPLHPLPRGQSKRARIKTLVEAISDFGPACVEYHQQIGVAADVSRRLPGRHHVLYRHNAIRPGRHPIDRLRYDRRYAAFSNLIFVSEAARSEFADTHARFAQKAHAICNPIDATSWLASPEGREPLIAFSGRAMQEKGVDILCEALARVLPRHPQWRAAMALGDWDKHGTWAAPHVARLMAAAGDRVDIRRSAPLGEVADIMRKAAIAVIPSVWAEPLGLTALEAHVAGAAVISSGRGGLREASGPHALYVEDLTADGLAQAIEQLILDRDRRLSLARAGQAFALQTHSPQARATQLDDLRAELVSRPQAARRGWFQTEG